MSKSSDLFGHLSVVPASSPGPAKKQNAHLHLPPNFSAFETVEQVADLAADQGLAVACASNYYDYRVYERFARLSMERGVFPVFGLEVILTDHELAAAGVRVNDPSNPGRIYLCGVGTARIMEPPAGAKERLAGIRASDERRMAEMVDRVNAAMADRGVPVTLSVDAIVASLVERHGVEADSVVLQERHLAQALQQAIFAAGGDVPTLLEKAAGKALKSPSDPVACQNDLRSSLLKAGKAAYAEERFADFATVKGLILDLGGIPCYPALLDGADPIPEFETDPDTLVSNLRARGVHMAQIIPRRNKPEVAERYAEALREAGIVLTIGTEHNTLELIPLQPACIGGVPLSERLMDLAWEGACIAAAHQVLVGRGEPGYVDASGQVVGDPDELRRIGEALVAQVAG